MSARTFGACVDLTGQTVGTIQVVRAVSVYPPRYRVRCIRCWSTGILGQVQIQRNQFCPLNSTCFRAQEYEWRYPTQSAPTPTAELMSSREYEYRKLHGELL